LGGGLLFRLREPKSLLTNV